MTAKCVLKIDYEMIRFFLILRLCVQTAKQMQVADASTNNNHTEKKN